MIFLSVFCTKTTRTKNLLCIKIQRLLKKFCLIKITIVFYWFFIHFYWANFTTFMVTLIDVRWYFMYDFSILSHNDVLWSGILVRTHQPFSCNFQNPTHSSLSYHEILSNLPLLKSEHSWFLISFILLTYFIPTWPPTRTIRRNFVL